ncbi:MAG: histidinol-phosphatase HisJ family protein [Clostridiales bacterium]|nr:histidinol-phosphatase HisJ family protein [Clostridiales bacterium]
MLIDYHLHTARCGHARGTMEEYVNAARAKGIVEIGFADHIPMYWLPEEERDPELAMTMNELPEYVNEVEDLRERFKDITIWLGIEADYIPGEEEKLKQILFNYPFDYVLGSVHYIDGWGFDNPSQVKKYSYMDIEKLYYKYFALLKQAARSKLFDIMAHPDLIKKFGYVPRQNINNLYRETSSVFKNAGVKVELNTSGLRAPVGEIYPHYLFVQECINQGIKFTLGSDAHSPEDVGKDLDKAVQLAAPELISSFYNR